MISKSAIRAVFKDCFNLKKDESCLIITDDKKEFLARQFYDYASKNCLNYHIEVMKPLKEHGQEPQKRISDLMLRYDVELLITDKSLTHTKARRDANAKGARIASMPTLTEDIANRCLEVDYGTLKNRSLKLFKYLSNTNIIKISTELGTEILLERGDRKISYPAVILDEKGVYGNLPTGEVCFSPINSNGVYVVDGSFSTFKKLKSYLTFKVKDNFVIEINGKQANELITKLNKIGKNAYLIAELGIGTNPKAKVTGNVLEDEKVLGTCHIAIGNNISYGGKNDVPLHLDGIITKPTIYLDNKIIIDKGKPKF